MSLVLEALRKQQADADPSAAATLGLMVEQRRRQRVWIALLTVALLLNAAVFAWLFRDRLTVAPGRADAAGAAPVAELVAPADTPSDQARAEIPAPAEAAVPPPAAVATTPQQEPYPSASAAAPPPRVVERVTLDALPSSSRSRFPGLAISTHVYADDASMRAIVVNGERLQEGDAAAGLTIREITESGVVVEFEDYLVEVPVFTDW